jgi:hypothetical protein
VARQPAQGNVISGNDGHGISFNMFSGQFPRDSDVQGNFIGTDATGTVAIGNLGSGISIFGSNNIASAGTAPNAGNVIAGNRGYGVEVSRAASFGNLIAGNFIGVDATGAIPWGTETAASPSKTRRTTSSDRPGFPNIIGGNGDAGILLMGLGSTNNLVQSNYIGATPPGSSGSVAIPNAGAGVAVRNGASGNFIGSSTSGNIIAGNTGDGVLIDHADNNVVSGNRIGQVDVAAGFFGNGGAGVNVNDSLGIRIGKLIVGVERHLAQRRRGHSRDGHLDRDRASKCYGRQRFARYRSRWGDGEHQRCDRERLGRRRYGTELPGKFSGAYFRCPSSPVRPTRSRGSMTARRTAISRSISTRMKLRMRRVLGRPCFPSVALPSPPMLAVTHHSVRMLLCLERPIRRTDQCNLYGQCHDRRRDNWSTSEFSQAVHADVAPLTARISNAAGSKVRGIPISRFSRCA